MEDFQLDIVVGKGPAASSIRLTLPPFTLVGATTRTGMITGPLRDRFGLVARLDYYDDDELEAIVTPGRRHPRRRRSTTTARGRSPAARAARRASPTGCCAGCATSPRCAATARSTADIARDGLALFGVDDLGLDKVDRAHPRRAVPAVRRRAGRPVDAGDQRRRAARDGRGRVRAVPHPAGHARPHARGRVAMPAAYTHLGLAAARPRAGPPARPVRLTVALRLDRRAHREVLAEERHRLRPRRLGRRLVVEHRGLVVVEGVAGGLDVEHEAGRGRRARRRRASTPSFGMKSSASPKWNSVGQVTSSIWSSIDGHARAVVADAARWGRRRRRRRTPACRRGRTRSRPGVPVDRRRARPAWSTAATQSATALRRSRACRTCLERRGEAGLVVVLRPAGREAPEHVRRADDVAGRGEALGDGADVRADAEDLLDQHEAGPGAGLGHPDVHVHVADVARHGDGRRERSSATASLAHRSDATAAPVAWRGVRLDDFDYELPRRAHRPGADRATRRGAAARRPRRSRRPSTATCATCPSSCAPATCSSSTRRR